jgi:lipopolysaccharide/colanic/teichoic acid biosynthesis glycosyltransferase
MKRAIDFALSLVGLILLAPAFVALAILVKSSSKGPIFFRGTRVGRNGKLFRIFKFRTMVANAERLGGSCVADDDVRITPAGRWLRKFKLDELPQLLNVLNGTMSLVGPRPEVEKFVKLFNEEEKKILNLRPGITDWATLWDSDEGAALLGSSDPEQTYLEAIRPEKIRLQLEYFYNQSFWVDSKILATTVWLVIKRLFGVTPERSARGKQSAGDTR